jgi:hypothetical protein
MAYKGSAIFYLVLLVLHLLRPVFPVIEYGLRKDYIAKYLCENRNKPNCCCKGKCYLRKQIAKHSDNNEANDRNNHKRSSDNEIKEYLTDDVFTSRLVRSAVSLKSYQYGFYSFDPIVMIFVPPKLPGLYELHDLYGHPFALIA